MIYDLGRCELIFNSVENSKWRVWKIIDEDNKCYQNQRNISTPTKLLKFIQQAKNPNALYVSISTFLNPTRNHGFHANQKVTFKDGTYKYPRAGYIVADCIMLDSYFFIDLDSESDLRKAQEEGRKIINALDAHNDVKLHSIQFSGKKGIHLIYNHKINPIANPIDRIKIYQDRKKLLITSLIESLHLNLIDKGHIGVISDPFRVYAAPYSLKPNGSVVMPLNLKDFMEKDIYTLITINSSKNEGLNPLVREGEIPMKAKVATNNTRGRGRANLSTYPHHYGLITNMVPGLRQNYVPFIKIHKKRLNHIDFNGLLNDISNMILFEEEKYYWIISTKTFLKPKLLKIMRRLKAVNYSEFQRRYSKFRFTNILDKDKNEISKPPKPVYIKSINNNFTHSRAHAKFFKELNADKNLIGREELTTYKSTVRT